MRFQTIALIALVAAGCGTTESASVGESLPEAHPVAMPEWLPAWATAEVMRVGVDCQVDATAQLSLAPDYDIAGTFDYALLVDGQVSQGDPVSDLYFEVDLGGSSVTRIDRGSPNETTLPLPTRTETSTPIMLQALNSRTHLYDSLEEATFLLTVVDSSVGQVVSEVILVGPNEELAVVGWCDGWSLFERLTSAIDTFTGSELELITGPSAEALAVAVDGPAGDSIQTNVLEDGLGNAATTATVLLYVPAVADSSDLICIAQDHELCTSLATGALLPFEIDPEAAISVTARTGKGESLGEPAVVAVPLPTAIKISLIENSPRVAAISEEFWLVLSEAGTEPALTGADGRLHLPDIDSIEELEALISGS